MFVTENDHHRKISPEVTEETASFRLNTRDHWRREWQIIHTCQNNLKVPDTKKAAKLAYYATGAGPRILQISLNIAFIEDVP